MKFLTIPLLFSLSLPYTSVVHSTNRIESKVTWGKDWIFKESKVRATCVLKTNGKKLALVDFGEGKEFFGLNNEANELGYSIPVNTVSPSHYKFKKFTESILKLCDL